MGRTTKQLSGGGKDKFLRKTIASEASIPPDAAQRLSDQLCGTIADLRVRRQPWQRETKPEAKPGGEPVPAAPPPVPVSAPVSAPVSTFDPFCFSALAVLTKQGAAALLDKLSGIAAIDQLRALARAQHLPVDPGLADASSLRAAIVAATESRLKERRAAAS